MIQSERIADRVRIYAEAGEWMDRIELPASAIEQIAHDIEPVPADPHDARQRELRL